ncbi:MAG: hypothetical protein O6848_05275 [Bacteroidetes bacterium]|nr:hypothetical protein [Bacteroidota bacterium]
MKKLLTALVFSVAMVLVGCEDPGQEVFEDFERISGRGSAEIDATLEVGGIDEEKSTNGAEIDADLE